MAVKVDKVFGALLEIAFAAKVAVAYGRDTRREGVEHGKARVSLECPESLEVEGTHLLCACV